MGYMLKYFTTYNLSTINVFNKYFDLVKSVYNNHPKVDLLLGTIGEYNVPSANFTNSESHFNDKLSYLNLFQ